MMKTSVNVESVEKIDVEELIKDFKIMNLETFTAYLKEVWRVEYIYDFYFIRISLKDQMIKPRESTR